MPSPDLYVLAAVHEAGHAVVGLAVGAPPISVELRGCGGECFFPAGLLDTLDPLDCCAICFAGRLAAQQVLGYFGGDAYAPDYTRAVKATRHLVPSWGQFQRQRGADKARELICQHRRAIVTLAETLLARGRLTGAEVAALLLRYGVGVTAERGPAGRSAAAARG